MSEQTVQKLCIEQENILNQIDDLKIAQKRMKGL